MAFVLSAVLVVLIVVIGLGHRLACIVIDLKSELRVLKDELASVRLLRAATQKFPVLREAPTAKSPSVPVPSDPYRTPIKLAVASSTEPSRVYCPDCTHMLLSDVSVEYSTCGARRSPPFGIGAFCSIANRKGDCDLFTPHSHSDK